MHVDVCNFHKSVCLKLNPVTCVLSFVSSLWALMGCCC